MTKGQHIGEQGIMMLLASGWECLIEVGFVVRNILGGAECDVTCRLSKQYLYNLRNEGS